jgi:hypothetical protein
VRGAASASPPTTRTGSPPGVTAAPEPSVSAVPADGHDAAGTALDAALSESAFVGAFTCTFDTGVDLSGTAAAGPPPGGGTACAGVLTRQDTTSANAPAMDTARHEPIRRDRPPVDNIDTPV